MDPITGTLAKAVAGAVVDKVVEVLKQDQTAEDGQRDLPLKNALTAKVDAAAAAPVADGVRHNPSGLRAVG